MKRIAVSLTFALSLSLAAVAHAQDPAVTEAQKRFQEGLELADHGKHDEARVKFQQALSAYSTPSVYYNLARAEQLTGHDFEALQHYKQFLRMGEIDPKITDAMRERAKQNIAELNKKAGQLELSAPAQARITVDGQVVDAASFELVPVPPGKHNVEASFEGRVKAVVVECSAGVITKASFDFTQPGNTGTTSGGTPPPAEKPDDTKYWVSGGLVAAGLLGIGLGIGFAASSQNAKDAENALRTPGRCVDANSPACGDLKDARDKVDARATISTVSYVAGGVLLAGAVAAFVLWPKKTETRAGFAPLPGGGAVSLSGSF